MFSKIRKNILIALFVFAFPAGAFAQLYFAPRVNYPLPVSSTFVNMTSGDFNKDGVPDLAVANFNGASISVFLGLGPGTFGTGQNYTTGSGTGGIETFDVNKDGNLDIAVTNFNSNSISIFLGDGAGSFAPQLVFATGSGPQSPIPGDFNEDGNIDIVVANYTGNSISILLGNGTGTFVPTTTYPTSTQPEIVTADLNNDLHLDFVILHRGSGNIGVRLGTGAGTFGAVQAYTTGSQPSTVVIRDFNSDNILDVVIGNTVGNTVSILTGTGSGTLNPAVNFSTTGPSTIISNDYNADGKLDLAVANTGNNTVSIYTGSGDGTFSLYQFTTVGSSPAYMRLMILDLNNDNLFDIVTTNDGANLFGVLLGNIPPGGAGTALTFNGTNQEAQLGTWFNHQNFTVTMWVKPGATQVANATIIDNNHTASRSWALEQNGSVLNQYTFGGVQLNLTANEWQYIALVSNGGVSTIYRNGCLVGSFNSGAINYDGSQTLRLANFAGGGRNWNGELDEVRMYDTGLTLNQIQNSINGEIATTTANLIAYYRMNEGSGTFIYDGTINNHVSNLINGPVFQLSDWNLPIPTLDDFTPDSGLIGAAVTLTGTNFDPVAANNEILFNGTGATATASTATSITTSVPDDATTGKISVTAHCFTVVSVDDFIVDIPANEPPVIETSTTPAQVGSTITIDLTSLISDPDDNLDLSTLQLLTSTTEQGAPASINASHELIVDYNSIQFTGTDHITVRICDTADECAEQQLTIEVTGAFTVYNALSPDKNGLNEKFILENIEAFEDTRKNHVTIFNRWGDVVFEVDDYNNEDHVFTGLNKNGKDLPSGTYYYKIEFTGGRKAQTGYLSLKR
jgi:gliding motility-associated-like protein